MNEYRVYILDPGGQIAGLVVLDQLTDELALEAAKEFKRQRERHKLEIWFRSRLVGRV